MTLDYSKLQNGSDIRGVALEGVASEPVNLDKETAERLTRGFIMWLEIKTGKKAKDLTVSVGHDSRLSADMLKDALVKTLAKVGCRVFDCGLASTPAMFMSTVFDDYKADGAIMITASHLPFNRNGFKYFSKDGGLEKRDISTIISYAESEICYENLPDAVAELPIEKRDLIGSYSEFLKNKIKAEVNANDYDRPLLGLKIVVDAGNGAGGFYAKRILEPLGADVSGSQYLEPDGNFPNHQPNPENKEAMDAISMAVIASKADFGLIFDTDVDRAAAVDKSGNEISRNAIVAMAAALIAKEHPGTTVVTDSITSDELNKFLTEELEVKHLRFQRGYRNVINKSIELNKSGIDSQLAIETSGHAAYKENYFLDDGAYLATKIVIKAAQLKKRNLTIDRLIKGLEFPKEAKEVRFPIKAEYFVAYADMVLEGLKTWARAREFKGVTIVEPNFEGVRLRFDAPDLKGWCLLRKSLHDPLMPLNIEVTVGSCDDILTMITNFLRNYDEIELKK